MNYDVEEWYHDYHLTIGDDGSGSTSGRFNWCGSTCTRYTAVITNTANVDNVIHPGIHTWRWRSYAETDKCDQSGGKAHSMLQQGTLTARSFRNGERWMPVITLGPGDSATYIIELDLNKKGMTKDWSITAWGENGPLEVKVNGKAKQHWPHVDRNDSELP